MPMLLHAKNGIYLNDKFLFIGLIKLQNRVVVISIDYPAALSVIAPYPAPMPPSVPQLWSVRSSAGSRFTCCPHFTPSPITAISFAASADLPSLLIVILLCHKYESNMLRHSIVLPLSVYMQMPQHCPQSTVHRSKIVISSYSR